MWANLQEQVKKAFCYQNLFWPFTVWINWCSNLSLEFQKFFSITRTILVTKYHFFLFSNSSFFYLSFEFWGLPKPPTFLLMQRHLPYLSWHLPKRICLCTLNWYDVLLHIDWKVYVFLICAYIWSMKYIISLASDLEKIKTSSKLHFLTFCPWTLFCPQTRNW